MVAALGEPRFCLEKEDILEWKTNSAEQRENTENTGVRELLSAGELASSRGGQVRRREDGGTMLSW